MHVLHQQPRWSSTTVLFPTSDPSQNHRTCPCSGFSYMHQFFSGIPSRSKPFYPISYTVIHFGWTCWFILEQLPTLDNSWNCSIANFVTQEKQISQPTDWLWRMTQQQRAAGLWFHCEFWACFKVVLGICTKWPEPNYKGSQEPMGWELSQAIEELKEKTESLLSLCLSQIKRLDLEVVIALIFHN